MRQRRKPFLVLAITIAITVHEVHSELADPNNDDLGAGGALCAATGDSALARSRVPREQ
jgi:hypothetical protein